MNILSGKIVIANCSFVNFGHEDEWHYKGEDAVITFYQLRTSGFNGRMSTQCARVDVAEYVTDNAFSNNYGHVIAHKDMNLQTAQKLSSQLKIERNTLHGFNATKTSAFQKPDAPKLDANALYANTEKQKLDDIENNTYSRAFNF